MSHPCRIRFGVLKKIVSNFTAKYKRESFESAGKMFQSSYGDWAVLATTVLGSKYVVGQESSEDGVNEEGYGFPVSV